MNSLPWKLLTPLQKLQIKAEKERTRRARLAKERGDIPGKAGNQHYLTDPEKQTLTEIILNWPNPLTQPTIRDLGTLVFSFCYRFNISCCPSQLI
jgi:hypothetical protein